MNQTTRGGVCTENLIQPFFVIDQDMLAGTSSRIGSVAGFIRRYWPRFMKMRALMVGCAAGEGHLDGPGLEQTNYARALARELGSVARQMKTRMIVLKEFPAKYRSALQCFVTEGYDVRVMDSLRPNVHSAGSAKIPAGAELQIADVRDPAAVDRALEGMESVVHLAAKVGLGVEVGDMPD